VATIPVGPHPSNRWIVGDAEVDLSRAEPRVVRKVRVPAEPADVVLDLGRTAIVVVDMQNDFCTEGGHLSRRGVDCGRARALIEPINRVVGALRAVDVPVVWVSWAVRADRLDLSPAMPPVHAEGRAAADELDAPAFRAKGGWGALAGSWGARLADGLDVRPTDIQVAKRRFSGFFATELDAILRNVGVTTLLFAGVATDICVAATLQDAMFLGYDVVMLDDCVATDSPEFCVAAARHHVVSLFGFLARSTSVIDGLAGSR
jgi:nicotinamidase-related amidase